MKAYPSCERWTRFAPNGGLNIPSTNYQKHKYWFSKENKSCSTANSPALINRFRGWYKVQSQLALPNLKPATNYWMIFMHLVVPPSTRLMSMVMVILSVLLVGG